MQIFNIPSHHHPSQPNLPDSIRKAIQTFLEHTSSSHSTSPSSDSTSNTDSDTASSTTITDAFSKDCSPSYAAAQRNVSARRTSCHQAEGSKDAHFDDYLCCCSISEGSGGSSAYSKPAFCNMPVNDPVTNNPVICDPVICSPDICNPAPSSIPINNPPVTNPSSRTRTDFLNGAPKETSS